MSQGFYSEIGLSAFDFLSAWKVELGDVRRFLERHNCVTCPGLLFNSKTAKNSSSLPSINSDNLDSQWLQIEMFLKIHNCVTCPCLLFNSKTVKKSLSLPSIHSDNLDLNWLQKGMFLKRPNCVSQVFCSKLMRVYQWPDIPWCEQWYCQYVGQIDNRSSMVVGCIPLTKFL